MEDYDLTPEQSRAIYACVVAKRGILRNAILEWKRNYAKDLLGIDTPDYILMLFLDAFYDYTDNRVGL